MDKMINNKAQQQPDGMWKLYLFIFGFILAGVAIYFLGKVAIVLGFIGLFISIILFIVATNGGGDDAGYLAISIFIISLVLIFGGWAITSFFENNETGKIWLGSGKTIINSTAQTYKTARSLG